MTDACAQVKPLTGDLVAHVLDQFRSGRNPAPPALLFPGVPQMDTDRGTPRAGTLHRCLILLHARDHVWSVVEKLGDADIQRESQPLNIVQRDAVL